MFKQSILHLSVLVALAVPASVQAQDTDNTEIRAQLELLKARIAELEEKLEQQEQVAQQQQQEDASVDPVERRAQTVSSERIQIADVEQLEERLEDTKNTPIEVGGAVRFQYEYADYNEGNKDRIGDLDFDIFRLDLRGEMGDVILSAQYRWFNYMDVVQHAYFGYNFTDDWQGQIGVVSVPFGIMPYNSHSYFFNSTFYAGLEDEYDGGVRFLYRTDDWDFDVGFYKADEQGGVDTAASSRADRYSYETVGVRLPGNDIYADPELPVAESNSWALRGARKLQLANDSTLELGLSAQWGDLHDGADSIGDRQAFAAHAKYNYERWEFMAQVADYKYDVDVANEGIVVGAYAYYDTIPASATFYTANVAYNLPVDFGPVTSLTFYNDFSLMTNKQGYDEDTTMNVLGMAVAAGGMYTYFDIVTARNQPFIGGSMVGESEQTNTRFNINFGYYF